MHLEVVYEYSQMDENAGEKYQSRDAYIVVWIHADFTKGT